MNTLYRLAVAALTAAGLIGTASAHDPYPYPQPQPPIRTFPPAYPTYPTYRPPVVVQQPVFTPPVVVVQRPPVVVQPPAVPVYCLDDFIRDFRPTPGKHHIAVIHPVTKQPVEVCFTLPDCKLREVEVERREIEFVYGPFHKVRIVFHRDGTACVHGG